MYGKLNSYSHSLLLGIFLTDLLMGFGSECLYCFHYPDSLGYLIFCCHGVATGQLIETVIKTAY